MSELEASRRKIITGIAAAGVAVPVLAACGGGSTTTGTTPTSSGDPTGGSTGTPGKPGAGSIPTADIPVGGGKIFGNQKIVVTQPKAGEFKAFSAICTHQGCTVAQVADGSIDCPCHGSTFSIEDGSVTGGPAPQPLPEKTVTVSGNTLTVT